MKIFEIYPELKELYDSFLTTRRDEILTHMIEHDEEYKEICRDRAEKSMKLKNALTNAETSLLFEEYSDTVYRQESYELDYIYKQAIIDVIDKLKIPNLVK